MLFKKQDKITKYEFHGYKLLYENSKEQVMVNVYKKSDKFIIIRYEAENDYFDILLDSIRLIIYNLNIKDKNFDLKNNLNLNMADTKYSKIDELDNSITKNTTYEIAKNNYYVEYSIPSNFKLRLLDSTSGVFDLTLDSGRIDIAVNILNKNIYEYLDKDETSGVFNNYKYYKNDEDYSNFEETLAKLESNYDSYIYKNSYIYNKDMLIYDYEVHYELTTLSAESIINNINSVYIKSNYGEAHELTYSGDLTLNSKVFKVYDGGYIDLSGIIVTDINRHKYYVNKKVLFYEIPDKGNLYIEINGNGKGLGDKILNELTNIIIEVKEN